MSENIWDAGIGKLGPSTARSIKPHDPSDIRELAACRGQVKGLIVEVMWPSG